MFRTCLLWVGAALAALFFLIPPATAQYLNRGLRLQHAGDYLSVSHSPSLAPAQITLECWVALSGTPGEQTLIDKRDVGGGYSLRIAGGSYPLGIGFVLKQTGEDILWVGDLLQKHTWYHIAATYDGDTARLYLNSRLAGSMASTRTITSTSTELRLGEFGGYPGGGSLGFRGLLDDIRIWNVARTETEIRAAMNSALPGSTTGLAAYWRCNGGTADATPNMNHALLEGGPVFVPSTAPVGAEAVNSALRIDGSGAYAQVAHAPHLSPPQITVECWIKKDAALDAEYTILDKRGSGSGYNLRLAGSSFPLGVYWVLDGSGTSLIVGATGISPHAWTHVAATYDGDTARLYINGELAGFMPGTLNIAASTAPLRIGEFLGHPGGSLRLRGSMDELRIWSSARSGAEIRADMHRHLTALEPGLAGFWRFNENAVSSAFDATTFERTAVLNPPASFITSDAPVGYLPAPAPKGFRPAGEDNRVVLRWLPAANGVAAYVLHRSSTPAFEPTAFTLVDTIPHPAATYTDPGIPNGTRAYYRLQSVDTAGHPGGMSPELAGKAAPVLPDYMTGVYYYPWYSNTWGHSWPGAFVRDYLSPRHGPALGQYDSRDSAVVSRHLAWSRDHGIDLWVCSWWGPGSNEDVTTRDHLLPRLGPSDPRFTVFYESPLLGPGPWVVDPPMEAALRDHFLQIARTYFGHPNFYRVGGRPVVFIYLSFLYQGDHAGAFTRIRQTLADSGYGDVYLVGDEVGWGAPGDHMNFLDAVSPYAFLGTSGYGLETDFFSAASMKYSEWELGAAARGKAFIPVAVNGFNNPGGSLVVPRQSGPGQPQTSFLEDFVKMGRPFTDPGLNLFMITSFNEWHEDTQIEPTVIAPPTTTDTSTSGTRYTRGYAYEGYGTSSLEKVRELLGGGGSVTTRTLSVTGGWNLVSVPLTMADYTKTVLFPTATSDAFSYVGSYVAAPTLANGRGYWMKFGAGQSVILTGFPRSAESIPAWEGWNIIGSISSPLAVEHVASSPPGLVTSQFFGYGPGGYVAAASIRPGEAYWVKIAGTGILELSGGATRPEARITIRPTADLPPPPPGDEAMRGTEAPAAFALEQNYPNPFNPIAEIGFRIADRSPVNLTVYDLLGRRVATLVDDTRAPGVYSVTLDASNLAGGTYLYRLTAGGFTAVRRMLLVK